MPSRLRQCQAYQAIGLWADGMHDPSIGEWRAEKMLGDAYYNAEKYDNAFETYLSVNERVPRMILIILS